MHMWSNTLVYMYSNAIETLIGQINGHKKIHVEICKC